MDLSEIDIFGEKSLVKDLVWDLRDSEGRERTKKREKSKISLDSRDSCSILTRDNTRNQIKVRSNTCISNWNIQLKFHKSIFLETKKTISFQKCWYEFFLGREWQTDDSS